MSLKGKLTRYKSHLSLEKSNSTPNRMTSSASSQEITVPYLENWKSFQTLPYLHEDQYILVRKKAYPLSYQHGHHVLNELYNAVEGWRKLGLNHPLSSHNKSAEELLFFDTETTGLSQGTGNTIFLLGTAKIKNENVEITQYFLPGPGHEVALYHKFLDDVQDLNNLVTYNGKAFDWPQVKTRHTMLRDRIPKLPLVGHFDLLHASRRLWKDELEAVKLSIVEKERLGIVRKGDVPGYLAPMLYFDFLKDPNPEAVEGIFHHNEIDVLSLISLYIHLSEKLINLHGSHLSANEQFQLARWFDDLGFEAEAQQRYQLLISGESQFSEKAQLGAARLFKKANQHVEAEQLWKEVVNKGRYGVIEASLELAKLFEHTYKDFEQAYAYAEQAYIHWKERSRLYKVKEEKERADFQKRLLRLQQKLARK